MFVYLINFTKFNWHFILGLKLQYKETKSSSPHILAKSTQFGTVADCKTE